MFAVRLWRHFDWWLFIAIILLSLMGIAMIYSATLGTPDMTGLPVKQATWVGVGLIAFFIMATLNYRDIGGANRLLYIGIIALLLIALVMGGSQIGDVQRWVSLPLFDVQPAEPVKVLLIIVLARYLADHEEDAATWRVVLSSLALVAVPTAMVLAQPNLSTAIVLIVIWGAMVFAAGLRWYHIAALSGAGIVALPLIWFSLKEYMQKRILVFLGLVTEPGARFNIDQALISIGNGGILGLGYTHGLQNKLHFLRVRHTDFIFSVIAEELGLVGALCLFALFTLLLFRLLHIAYIARDPLGRYYIIGVTAMIFFTAMANIAMNLSLMPVAGLPLPFISYGGSSLFTLFLALGIAESVAMRYKKLEF